MQTPNGTVIFWTFQPAPAEQMQRAGARIAAAVRTYELFLLALEAQCGKEKLRRALAWMVRSLRGKPVGYEDLRSALEGETRQNLSELFRVWLKHPGIPGDFRARYEEKNEPTK